MAKYERSPRSSHRSYKPRDRTSDWVSHLPSERATQFVDPGMPPSDTESAVYSSDSDAESTRSVPPRFVLRFPDGREERVSDGYYSNTTSRSGRSRAASGPVNHYGPPPPHHHSRSMSLQTPGGYPVTPGYIPRPPTSNTNVRPQEQIRILPTRSRTPGAPGYSSSRAYGRDGHQDDFVLKHGPPEPIKFSNSHPPSKFDPPTRDYSASGYRPHQSSKLRPSVLDSPASQVSQLTKENTLANSHSRILPRGIIEDNWSVIDEDEGEWAREQQRAAAYRRGRTYSSSSGSPPLSYSRSRTTSSSSRSDFYPPGPKFSAPEKMGPPPSHSTGASSRSFFSRLFRVGSDKHLPIAPHHNRLHRRHSIGDSRR